MRHIKTYILFESKKDEKSEDKLPKLSDLKIVSIDTIEGKNKWHESKDKLIHMVLDLGDWEEFPSDKIPEFYKNIKKYLPSMNDHRCSEGRKGGFFYRVKRGTWLGHIIEHIALEIQTLSGHDTGFGRTRGTGKKGEYNVIFNYEEKPVGILAAKEAVKVAKALIKEEDPKIKEVVKKLKEIKK
jgi:cyanophycin synthetase